MGYKFLDSPTSSTILLPRSRTAPCGIFGGKAGKQGFATLTFPSGKKELLGGIREDGRWVKPHTAHFIPVGSAVELAGAGGGGYGDPLERDPKMILEDVLDEYVSIKKAREDYGVVISPETFEIDFGATKELRQKSKRG